MDKYLYDELQKARLQITETQKAIRSILFYAIHGTSVEILQKIYDIAIEVLDIQEAAKNINETHK